MRGSIILCAVVAIGSAFTLPAFAQANRSVSITIHGVTESKSIQANDPFSQSVQDSYNDMAGMFGINETALSQQTSAIRGTAFGTDLDVSVGGTVSFHMTGQDHVQTMSTGSVTFTLDAPANFSLTENSNLESDPMGTDGEVWFYGGTLVPGTNPVVLFQPNLIPYIWQLYDQQVGDGMSTPNLTYSSTLAPGTYTYNVFAAGDGTDFEGGSLTFSSDFQLSPIPEPLALPLLAMTALALLRTRSGNINSRMRNA